jgi:UDP-N-acetyl-D-glucosamine dehydrogenase
VEEGMPEQNIWEESSGLAVMSLHKRIHSQSAEVGIMGLGYVGLTEAVEFARSGFRVTGFDVDVNRIKHIQVGRSYLIDSADQELGVAVESRKLRATNDFALL